MAVHAYPAGQGPQAEAPTAENVAGAHVEHDVDAFKEKVPDAHSVAVLALHAAPAGQTTHAVSPVVGV